MSSRPSRPAGACGILRRPDRIHAALRGGTQRSVLKVEEARLLPLLEYPKSRELFAELREQSGARSRLRGAFRAGN